MAKTREEQVRDFSGLVSEVDDYDIGASAATVLTNFTLHKTAELQTRQGFVLCTFESEQ